MSQFGGPGLDRAAMGRHDQDRRAAVEAADAVVDAFRAGGGELGEAGEGVGHRF